MIDMLSSLDRADDGFCRAREIIRWNNIQAAVFQDLFAEIDVGALQTNNERNAQADFF